MKNKISFNAINVLNVTIIIVKFSFKNFMILTVPLIAVDNPLPIVFPKSAIVLLFVSTVFFKSPKLSFNAPKKPLATST